MKMHKKITSVLSVLLLMSMLLTACSGDGGSAAVTNDTADTTAAEVTEAETTAAPYSDINLDGYEMRILNVAGRLWNTMSVLDYETLSGDIVEDAVYNRNRAVESKLNIKLNVITPSDTNSGIQNELNKAVSAGDDLYDAAYTTSDNMSANIVNGYYLNLKDIDTVQLGEAWWDPAFNDVLELNNKYLYQASSPLHLMAFDMSIACYFNKDMFVEKGLTIPYDLVREGKWTYDEMMKIIKAGINLNGDDKFDKSQKGNSTFGIATFAGWAGVLTVASDSVVGKDSDGVPTFTG
nr:hypothetical protein [Clostridia bacterium]